MVWCAADLMLQVFDAEFVAGVVLLELMVC